jgi:hypothetical protein
MSFNIQAILQVVVGIILLFIPKVYFEVNLFKFNKEDNAEQDAATDADVTIFKYKEINKNDENFWRDFCILMKHKVYMVSTAAVTILLFIVTAITFWISDYLKVVLKIEQSLILTLFVVTCVTAPTAGIMIGGCAVQKLGGYESKIASVFVVICGIISACCSIAIPLFDNIIGFTIFLWLFLAFGSAIVPNIIGIYISSLPIELRGSGNSISATLINAIGHLPAPYIYGAIMDATKNENNKIALIVTLNLCWLGAILLIMSLIFRNRDFAHRQSVSSGLKVKEIEISVNVEKELELVENVNNTNLEKKRKITSHQ